MSTINIIYKQPSTLERMGINTANAALFAGKATGVSFIKGQAYDRNLDEAAALTDDERLSIDGRQSPYDNGAGDVVRNVMVLMSYDKDIQLVFSDINIQVSARNTIVETPLTGRRGSIKEYIQAEDYDVKIKGNLISGKQNAFPFYQLQSLVRLLRQTDTFKVKNKYLEAFDIYEMALKRANFNQDKAKYMNVLPFELNFISDERYELEVD